MAYFWRCPLCQRVYTFDDDEDPKCPTDHLEEADGSDLP